MKWYIEINCQEQKICDCGTTHTIYIWKKLRPSNGQPYEFKTRQEAVNTAQMCYANNMDSVRITHD